MGAYTYLAYFATVFFGSILSLALLGSLGMLVYLLIWTDVFIIAKMPFIQTIGFELLTLASITGGMVLGPLAGLLFGIFGIPILITVLIYIVKGRISPRIPNIGFVAMGLAAAFAGFLVGVLPFVWVAVIAVLLKQVAHAMVNLRISFGVNKLTSTVNTLFSIGFLILLGNMGLLKLLAV